MEVENSKEHCNAGEAVARLCVLCRQDFNPGSGKDISQAEPRVRPAGQKEKLLV